MQPTCRPFVYLLWAFGFTCLATPQTVGAVEFYVSPAGSDSQPGTRAAPFATLERARDAVRTAQRSEATTIWMRAGVHQLTHPLILNAADGGTPAAPVTYAAFPGEKAEISGARELTLSWTQNDNGRWQARVPAGLEFDQLFADGAKIIRARYPNFDLLRLTERSDV